MLARKCKMLTRNELLKKTTQAERGLPNWTGRFKWNPEIWTEPFADCRPTDDVLRLKNLLEVFCVVNFSWRKFLFGLVFTGAPPLSFGAPPVSVRTLLHPDDIKPLQSLRTWKLEVLHWSVEKENEWIKYFPPSHQYSAEVWLHSMNTAVPLSLRCLADCIGFI